MEIPRSKNRSARNLGAASYNKEINKIKNEASRRSNRLHKYKKIEQMERKFSCLEIKIKPRHRQEENG